MVQEGRRGGCGVLGVLFMNCFQGLCGFFVVSFLKFIGFVFW